MEKGKIFRKKISAHRHGKAENHGKEIFKYVEKEKKGNGDANSVGRLTTLISTVKSMNGQYFNFLPKVFACLSSIPDSVEDISVVLRFVVLVVICGMYIRMTSFCVRG